MDKLYIVTGGYGHLGNTVVKELVRRGQTVRALVLPTDKSTSLDGYTVEVIKGNVCDALSLEALFKTKEPRHVIVIHTAGIVTIASKFQQIVYDVNVTGTKNIIAQCLKHKVEKLVHVSSVHAIPEIANRGFIKEVAHFNKDEVFGLYAKTKAEATQAVLDSVKDGLDAVVVNPSGIIGPYDYGHGHITQLIMDYLDGRLTSGIDGGYDFIDVRDVANGVLSAAQKGRAGECYILSGGFHTIRELLGTLHKVSGKRKIKSFLPIWFVKLTAPLAEIYYKFLKQPPLFTKYSLYTLASNSNFSNKKAVDELGFTTRDFSETLNDTVKWLRENNRVKKK
ncbi:MAG: NAD-dependent epimerase/dehydratase family protein [Oscillospiraceae bacterium]